MMFHPPTKQTEFQSIWVVVVVLACLVGVNGYLMVKTKQIISDNIDELDRRGVWMESINTKMADRFTGQDFQDFLDANPELNSGK